MNQKDYKAIAEIIGNIMREYKEETKKSVVAHGMFTLRRVTSGLADYFKKQEQENQFSEKQFLKDCGAEE